MWACGNESQGDHLVDRDADWQGTVDFHVFDLRDLSLLVQGPKFLQHFIELFFVGHSEDFLGGNFAVMQLNTAIGEAGNNRVVGHHNDGASLLV